MDNITVYKLDEQGQERWQYAGTVLERLDHCIRLEAFFDLERFDLGEVVFLQGDRFVETFYSDRWYNIFAVYDKRSNALKGWYCNICRPAQILDEAVRCEDLALDLWVQPDGSTTLMDEDEYGELELSPEERRQSRLALQELLELAAQDRLPR